MKNATALRKMEAKRMTTAEERALRKAITALRVAMKPMRREYLMLENVLGYVEEGAEAEVRAGRRKQQLEDICDSIDCLVSDSIGSMVI